MSQNTNGKVSERMPDTEVVKKVKCRRYTAEYKLRISKGIEAPLWGDCRSPLQALQKCAAAAPRLLRPNAP